jgi:SM-20-related protein
LLPLRLSRDLQPRSYRPIFKQHGRLHIPGILDQASAAGLYASVKDAKDWTRAFHLGPGRDVDIYVRELEALPAEERARLEQDLVGSSSEGLRYVFDTVRITSELKEGGRPVSAPMRSLHDFVNGRGFLDFIRELTGDDRVAFADVMATRYLPGHFAAAHGDELAGQKRLYAFVLNLTPEWRTDWGGVLTFHDSDGHIAEGYTPKFNALNVFAVPQTHAVSFVTPMARAPRLSVTGWVHARA